MPDSIVFTVFGMLSGVSLIAGIVAGYFAYKYSADEKTELRMVFWGIVSIAGLTFGGLIWAWFLIPIIRNHI